VVKFIGVGMMASMLFVSFRGLLASLPVQEILITKGFSSFHEAQAKALGGSRCEGGGTE
jgi:hypothetical protein